MNNKTQKKIKNSPSINPKVTEMHFPKQFYELGSFFHQHLEYCKINNRKKIKFPGTNKTLEENKKKKLTNRLNPHEYVTAAQQKLAKSHNHPN